MGEGMLTIYGRGQRYCDRISRRSFLKIGGFTFGSLASLSLSDLLRAEAATGKRSRQKAVINIFLAGGPPHQDLWDLKMDAPSEIRGEFKPIATKVPGIQICEHMPRLAAMMDKFAIIRSLVGARDEHDSHICMSGYTVAETQQNHYPCLGSVLSKLQGPVEKNMPPFVGLQPKMEHMEWADPGDPGFLGLAHGAVKA